MNKKLLCLAFSLMFLVPSAAFAGVHKELVEVDAGERERLEKERVEMQEAYEEEGRRIAEERARREAEEAAARRVDKAEKLRMQEIGQRNSDYLARLRDFEANREVTNSKTDCAFFCRLFRIITLPIKLVITAFES